MSSDEITGDIGTGGVLPVGASLTGTLTQAGARAWYQVSLSAGESYFFTMAGSTTGQGTLRDPLLYLYDPTGDLITQNDDSGGFINSRITYTAQRTGTYFLGAGAYQDAQKGTFQLAAGSYADDYSAVKPGKLEVGGAQTGNLEVLADLDWFRVELKAGTRYTLTVQGVDTHQGTLNDPYLYVYSGEGKNLAQADDGGVRRNSLLDFTPESSGTFFLAVGAYQDASSGTYTLNLSEAPSQSSASQEKAPALARGANPQDAASSGQADWAALALEAASPYLMAQGWASTDGGPPNPDMVLYNPGGIPGSPALYYIDAGAQGQNDAGRYLLSLVGRQVEQFNADPAGGGWWQANPLANPLMAQGGLPAGLSAPPQVQRAQTALADPGRQPSTLLAAQAAGPCPALPAISHQG
jgi:hypothetical protein